MDKLEETQNEMKRREKLYGKNLDTQNVKFRKRGINNLILKTKYSNSNFDTAKKNKNNKWMKTVEIKSNIIL